jgi:hypothetical protein
MTDSTQRALSAATLKPGDRVHVHENGPGRYSAYVEETMPQLSIVWIRELQTGERRMLSTKECRIYRSDA